MHDEMTLRHASKFAIFWEYKNPCSFFRFSFHATLFFPLMNALVYVDIDQGIHQGKKYKVAQIEKKSLNKFALKTGIE